MKHLREVLCVLTLGILALSAGAQETDVYQAAEMHADLRKFETALAKIHPGTFTHQTSVEFSELMEGLILKTAEPMKPVDFFRLVLRLVASIHDGHTQVFAFGDLDRKLHIQARLPFDVFVQDERIFIVKNLSTKTIPRGSELLAIDGRLSNEVLKEILLHYSADGQSRSGMYHWLSGPYRPFNRLYPEIFGARSVHDLVYRNFENQEIVTTKINSISNEEYDTAKSEKFPDHSKNEQAFRLELDKNSSAAYMRIHRFIKDSFDEPERIYPDFYRQSFEKISANGISSLVIDLRDNGGGKTSNAAYLLQYLIEEPVIPTIKITTLGDDAYFSNYTRESVDLNASFGLSRLDDGKFKVTRSDVMRDLEQFEPVQEFSFDGEIIVLINGGTTSAAGIAAGLLMQHTDATFVGEESYGYAGISNGVRQVTIKGDHTEVAIRMPLLHSEHNIDASLRARGVVPHHRVSNSVEDILSGTDAVLEFVSTNLLGKSELSHRPRKVE